METALASFLEYNIYTISGEMKLAELPLFGSAVLKHIQSAPGKDLVLEMSKINYMDSSALRLIVNLKKQLDGSGRKLYILAPSAKTSEMFRSVNLDKVLAIVPDDVSLQRRVAEATKGTYAECTRQVGDMTALCAQCAVCGSEKSFGYLLDPFSFDWKWIEDDPFPTCFAKGTDKEFPYFEHLPVVCEECGMAATDPRFFSLVKDGAVKGHSRLDEQSKLILSKGIKRRKKTVETESEGKPSFFEYPRSQRAAYCAYALAENCAHSMAVERRCATPFSIGYLNYLTIQFSADAEKSTLIDNCRTWMTQVIVEKQPLTHQEQGIAFFILMNACLNLDKIKEAADAFQEFSRMIESMPAAGLSTEGGINSPQFWFDQAKNIWQGEIRKKSAQVKTQ